MNDSSRITTLFLDIGGVLLTNGWDRHSRSAAADEFKIELEEMEERHHLTFDTYEEGKLSLDDYLSRVVFFKDRSFRRSDFKHFMLSRSEPMTEMLGLIRKLIDRHSLRAFAVSNEGRELTEYRIRTFELASMIDAFVSSCFLHIRKPDKELYQIALDISQARPEQVIYIDDRSMFVEVARQLGINGIVHQNFASTRDRLAEYALSL